MEELAVLCIFKRNLKSFKSLDQPKGADQNMHLSDSVFLVARPHAKEMSISEPESKDSVKVEISS